MGLLSCLLVSFSFLPLRGNCGQKSQMFYCSQNHVKYLLGAILQLSPPTASPGHVTNLISVILTEEPSLTWALG